MGLKLRFRAAWRVLALLGLLVASQLAPVGPLHAQVVPPPPDPLHVDERGVNLTTGTLARDAVVDVSIGPDDHHGLRFSRQATSGWRLSDVPAMNGSTSNPIVSFGGRSIPFKTVSGVYVPEFEHGATLSNDRTVFTAADGTVINFTSNSGINFAALFGGQLARGTQVTFPDGTWWAFTWQIANNTYCPPYPGAGCTTVQFGRLSSINSSTGYQIKLSHLSNTLSGSGSEGNWLQITKATAINNAVEYCNPAAFTCTLTNTWPAATFASWIGTTMASVTDPAGRTTTYSGASSDTVTYAYTNNKVSSVTTGGGTWAYTYGAGSTTVTNPLSQAHSVAYTTSGFVTSATAGGQTTQFAYCTGTATCPVGLLQELTMPEGNKVLYEYDARGNVTKTTLRDKSGTVGNDIVTLAAYPSSCTVGDRKICNKPTSTTDARGQVTDYAYDLGHGGITSVTLPADASGVRPKTLFGYTSIYAYYKNSSGAVVQGPSPITVPDVARTCRTGTQPSCLGTADERQPTLVYTTSGAATNGQPYLFVERNGTGSLYAATTFTYDDYGRIKTVDGPLSGTADTTFYSYNVAGQPTGVISADPDGAGAALFPAVKYTYRPNGQIDYVQSGTVTAQSDAGWASFVELQRQTSSYDGYYRPIRQVLSSGGTTYQVTDQRYDSAGRVLCTMQRMDAGNWSTLPSSCSPTQTTGPNGPDRVTYNHYDALDRVWKVTTGYGTTAAADEQISTFTNNGKLLTLTDAEANRTTYEYNGHDRLVKTFFPSPTTDNTSSTTDYEQVGYDANGNVTSFRTRRNETLTMTFDNLNRMTLKVVPDRAGLDATHERDVYYGYDLFGNMTYARFDNASGEGITNVYDALGHLTSTTTNLDGVSRALSYLYDVAGNRTRITHPDANYVNYYQYASGAPYYAALNGGSNGLFNPTRDTAGRVNLVRRWNTSTAAWDLGTTYTFDGVSRLASFAHNPAGTTHDTTTTFGYNPASQLASSARTNDLYAWTGQAAVNRNYTANGLNQYSAITGLTGLGYDAGGNLTSDGTNTYVYDVENRLVTRSGGASATLRYDPLGRLHEVTGSTGTTRFLYDGSDLVAEYNTSGTMLRRIVHGTGAGDDPLVTFENSTVADSVRRYLYADERGSIVALTDGSGNVYAVNTYDEYGIPGSSNAGRFQYTGQVWLPELGMYYYKARMYSPTLGRFMQTDPIGYGDGMNMYAYVKNDPVNKVDPTGLDDQCLIKEQDGPGPPKLVLVPCTLTEKPGDLVEHNGQRGRFVYTSKNEDGTWNVEFIPDTGLDHSSVSINASPAGNSTDCTASSCYSGGNGGAQTSQTSQIASDDPNNIANPTCAPGGGSCIPLGENGLPVPLPSPEKFLCGAAATASALAVDKWAPPHLKVPLWILVGGGYAFCP